MNFLLESNWNPIRFSKLISRAFFVACLFTTVREVGGAHTTSPFSVAKSLREVQVALPKVMQQVDPADDHLPVC